MDTAVPQKPVGEKKSQNKSFRDDTCLTKRAYVRTGEQGQWCKNRRKVGAVMRKNTPGPEKHRFTDIELTVIEVN